MRLRGSHHRAAETADLRACSSDAMSIPDNIGGTTNNIADNSCGILIEVLVQVVGWTGVGWRPHGGSDGGSGRAVMNERAVAKVAAFGTRRL